LIKNPKILREFGDAFIRERGSLSYGKSLKIFEAMWEEGIRLGALPPKEPLEGIEVDIRVAKVLHSCSKTSCPE
jgi:hypothetical protein